MNKTLLTSLMILLMGASAASAAAATNGNKSRNPQEEKFDALLKQIQADPGSAREAQVQKMLALAKGLGKCHAASLVVRGYLSHHFSPRRS